MLTSQKPTIALVSNTAWSIYRFRLGLARALRAAGYEVLLFAPSDAYSALLIKEQFTFVAIEMRPHRGTIISEVRVFFQLLAIYRQYQPDLIFHYTIKPNIYGSMAARWLGIPCVAVVTGLGKFLSGRSVWRQWFIDRLYQLGCWCSQQIWFLNTDDKTVFEQKGLAPASKIRILASEGVNTDEFAPVLNIQQTQGEVVRLLFAGRLLREKGIEIYVEAAMRLRTTHPNIICQIAGFIDPENPDSVTHQQVKQWIDSGYIEYLGATDDMVPHIAACSCVVLPTYYREGVPRILMEAAAMSKPAIASDTVGCRDVIEHGKNGFLCKPKNVDALVAAIHNFVALSDDEKEKMGEVGRIKVLNQFDEVIIIRQYMDAIEELSTIKKFQR
jgi:glycosyltransferase involved in cell wall biosynthesis